MTAVLKALIWDVDGTVAETERDGHRVAYNAAFQALGLPWQWDVAHYGVLLQVAGGRERLLHDMAMRADAPATASARDDLARELHAQKNACYAAVITQAGITARPGVLRLMDECGACGVRLAVATTSSRANVDALFARLRGPRWRDHFAAVLCAEDVSAKKPHPQVYLQALQQLGLSAEHAFALEDSPQGLQAARAAGIACGVTRSLYFSQAHFEGAAWVDDDLQAWAATARGLRRHAPPGASTAAALPR